MKRREEDLSALMAPAFFRALSDPNRVALLKELAARGGACTVTEVAVCCPVDISVVSRHLATLRKAGILQSQKVGREVRYSVNARALVDTLREMADAIELSCDARESSGKGRG
jgi:ArsR family transcriptional regulator, arsenate/arsenite/antimonite-responsive transcriptional repressor